MSFKAIILLCLIALCAEKALGAIFELKIETPDVQFCTISNGTYNVDFSGPFFRFSDSSLAEEYIVRDVVGGFYYINQAGRNARFHLDEFIYNSLYGNNSYEYATNSTLACASNMATYMCSYTFVGTTPPCNALCDPVATCADGFTYGGQVIPPASVSDCEFQGSSASDCSAINMKGLMGDWKHKVVEFIPPTIDIHPGGLVRGSLLGFGVLIGLLLVIGSLGVIMKFQNK
ncbi:hypothetical protein DDB_G0269750 [Dictyostelium discoideum AX4]|uniref:Uncharacterized protein n=1 Tax=Dictyostelium discoideum TaxID=44689 RepID=Q55D84_DICDI|nr:hypothetical protein DDB_G0269750 [Dictyostelium discoideum AX4]EAL72225.1 hypothetical protein DDB_G0269750 [Dictyostelium discoideum AX4]|eukprot:XP_646247.1 hypothetical protein DDB_G0269750 [Dictyostelium discoideum AX4]